MINLTIDGRDVKAEEGLTLLQAARQNNIDIPTLCHHDALEPYGVCRLCTVEVTFKKRKRFVTACNYPVKEGIEVKTASPEVIEMRKMILELLLARCPDVKVIKDLAKSYGIEKSRFELEDHACILCGLCIRVCQEIIGSSAISLINRGVEVDVGTPFHISSETCIGCGACAAICPTGAIKLEYTKDELMIKPFNTVVKLTKCVSCGNPLAPEPFVNSVSKKLGKLDELVLLCENCKRKKESNRIKEKVIAFRR